MDTINHGTRKTYRPSRHKTKGIHLSWYKILRRAAGPVELADVPGRDFWDHGSPSKDIAGRIAFHNTRRQL